MFNTTIRGIFRRVVASIVSIVLVATPTLGAMNAVRAVAMAAFPVASFLAMYSRPALAGPFEDAAAAGNATGQIQLSNSRLPTSNAGLQTVTINSVNPTVNGTTLNLNQLFQGASSPANNALLTTGSATYGSTPQLNAVSGAQQATLLAPANTDPWANAYKTVRNTALTHDHPDMSQDPIARGADSIGKGTDPNSFINNMAAACTTVTGPTGNNVTTHVPDLQNCTRYNGTSSCRITRVLDSAAYAKRVFHIEGQVDDHLDIVVQLRTPNVIDWAYTGPLSSVAGTIAGAGGYFSGVISEPIGSGGEYTWNSVSFNTFDPVEWPVALPNQVVKAVGKYTSTGTIDFTYDEATELNGYRATLHIVNPTPAPPYCYDTYSSTICVPGPLVPFSADIELTVGIVTQQPSFDEPPGCSEPQAYCAPAPVGWASTGSVADQASTNVWQCTNADASRYFGPVELTGANFGPINALYPGEPTTASSPICYTAEARSYQCSYSALPPPVDNCGPLAADPTCVYKTTTCLPENIDPVSGKCIFFQETYDCGTDVSTGSVGPVTSCAGPVRCMGTDCATPLPAEVNPDFQNAAMAMQTAQWAQMDKKCDINGCEIFVGDGYSCKNVFFGVQNCCDTPVGGSFVDYIKLAYYTWKVADRKAIGQWLTDQGWDTMASAWEGLSTPVGETIENLTGPLIDASDSYLSRALEPFADALDEWCLDTFGETMGEMIGSAIGSGAGSTIADFMNSQLMTEVIGPMMTFMMYYAIAMLLIQIIWSCDPSEFELNVKKTMKQCHYLGDYCSASFLGICYEHRDSYCCYKSPLSRIIHEQLNSVFAIPFPGPSFQPACKGFTPAQLATVDWSMVDLSEWIADLKLANLMPADTTTADTMYRSDRVTALPTVTGTGATGNTGVQNATIGSAGGQPTGATAIVRSQLWGSLP